MPLFPSAACVARKSDIALDLGSFAGAAAQVVQFCTADLALAHHSHLLNKGAVDGEDTLDAHAVSNAANGKGLGDAAVLLGNDGALEGLDTLKIGRASCRERV